MRTARKVAIVLACAGTLVIVNAALKAVLKARPKAEAVDPSIDGVSAVGSAVLLGLFNLAEQARDMIDLGPNDKKVV